MMKKSRSPRVESASGSPSASPAAKTASKITQPGNSRTESVDWRQAMLARLRALILQADPEIVEERKWKKPSNPAGVPVFYRNGIVCTGETYKSAVKLTFARGAALDDPAGLFNSSLEGNVRRAIDFHEGDKLNEKGLLTLIGAAVALNNSKA